MDKDKVLKYLRDWRSRTSYEQTAMSEARFSAFLEGLLEIIDLRPICTYCGGPHHVDDCPEVM